MNKQALFLKSVFPISRAACMLIACIFGLVLLLSFPAVAFAQTTASTKDDHHEHSHDAHDHSKQISDAEAGSSAFRQLGVYAFLIAGASLLGGWLPTHIRFSHTQFQSLLSVVGGMLLGIGVFHLFPHAVHELGMARVDLAVTWMMGGIVMMFFLLRTFHVHHHEPPPADLESDSLAATPHTDDHQHHDSCQHHHGHLHGDGSGLSWAGMFFGLSIHTLLDGLALGASMQADAHHATGGWLGLGVLAGIVLHKPLDSLSITTLMINGKQSATRRVIVNLIYCLLCPLGAALFLWGVRLAGGETTLFVGAGLAFSAGIFLCIALADLLPEMEFHTHNRVQLSCCLLLGIALAWAIRFLEPGHLHH